MYELYVSARFVLRAFLPVDAALAAFAVFLEGAAFAICVGRRSEKRCRALCVASRRRDFKWPESGVASSRESKARPACAMLRLCALYLF